MKRIKKYAAAFLGIWMTASGFYLPVQADTTMVGDVVPAAETEAMDTAELADLLTGQYGAASVQYALLHEGEIVEGGSSGVYSRTENRALTKENMYGIGSVSKMYTAAAAMKLAEQGKIQLEEPVVTYLPEFQMADERYKKITAQMLMNHSSGLAGTSYGNSFLFGDADSYAHDHLLEHLKNQRLKAEPGEIAVYCNDGFTLLELVVEKVSGMSLTAFLQETFFAPAGLMASKTPQDSFDRSLLAKTYLPLFSQETPEDTVGIIGTGGIYSSAEDLCRFGEILAGDQPEILSKESALRMMEPEYKNGIWPENAENNSIAYGLGWDTVSLYPFAEAGIKALNKGGDTMLYHGSLVVLPEYHITAAVLSSGGSSLFDTMLAVKMIEQYMLQEGLLDAPLPAATITPVQKQPMPEEFKEYSGVYGATGNTIQVIVDNDELRVPPAGEGVPEQVFVYAGDAKFQTPDGSVILSFETKENGHTYLLMDSYIQIPGFGMTRSFSYNAQRVEVNPLSEEVLSVWQERNGKNYFLLNEKYTSQLMVLMASQKMTVDTENGYAMGCKIIDGDQAVNVMQIPMSNGRDTFDLQFETEEGKEYLYTRDMTLISEDGILPIYDGMDGICTIQADGYTRWYKVPEGEGTKQMKVSAPQKTAIFIYDDKNNCIVNSVITGTDTFTLPMNGKIAFSGAVGDVFEISVYDAAEES